MGDEIVDWIAREIVPYERDVRRWLKRIAPDRIDTDDIVQEAYSRLAKMSGFEAIRSGRSYFFTVAKNLIFEHIRRERVVSIVAVAEIDASRIIDEEPLADRIVAGRQQLALVHSIIGQLPERCRSVLMLRRFSGLSQRETAQKLGLTENIVEKELARGLKILVARLSDIDDRRNAKQEADLDDQTRHQRRD